MESRKTTGKRRFIMRNISTKDSAQRFYGVLNAADEAPVVIERRGRPRAVVISYARYRDYERLADETTKDAAVDALAKALDMVAADRVGLATRSLSRPRAPSPSGRQK
jgi:prevent-host-death family protein